MGWWMLFGTIWFVVFWGAIIYFIVSAPARMSGRTTEETPLEIARRRYARGEISKEEFDQLRRDLS
jgi:putative membrane protein